MEKKTWKVLAIVFMSLVVIETLLFGWLIAIGNKSFEKETECSTICFNDDSYDAYQYDYYKNICYCFTDNEVVYTKFID